MVSRGHHSSVNRLSLEFVKWFAVALVGLLVVFFVCARFVVPRCAALRAGDFSPEELSEIKQRRLLEAKRRECDRLQVFQKLSQQRRLYKENSRILGSARDEIGTLLLNDLGASAVVPTTTRMRVENEHIQFKIV